MANLTLSVEDDLLKQARIYAIHHDTSVNAMVREFLASVVNGSSSETQAARRKEVEELNRLCDEAARLAVIPEGYKWRREDAYEDRLQQWNSE